MPAFAGIGVAVVTTLAGIAIGVSLNRYGFFGDELYFVAAGHRPSFGYADQGPIVPLLAGLMDMIAPGSLVALRIPALLVTLAAIVVSALIARELGGSRSAQVLAAAAYATSPFLLLQGTTLSTNAIDTGLWVLITWLLIRWVRTRGAMTLLAAGAVTALDMQVKWLIPVFWLAVAIGVLIAGPRELFRRPALWIGAALTAAATAPTLVWQAAHGWPQLGMGAQVSAEQALVGGRWTFLPIALFIAGGLGVVLLIAGTVALLRWEPLRPFRFLGWTVLLVIVAFWALGGRPYYVIGCYPAVIAAGAVWWTRKIRWRKVVAVLLAVASGIFMVLSLPLKPESALRPATTDLEVGLNLSIFGRFGWTELREGAAAAYGALPEPERSNAVILTDAYWQASALDLARGAYGLPAVYSINRGFGYFGTPPDTATTVLWVGGTESELRQHFATVAAAGRVDARLGIPGIARDITIWRCDGPRESWSTAWPGLLRLG
ncbi:glycosyl transferase family 39 [Nocardia panacis]|uniref:Glycosyl transferase family 39 n=1 Tax=Nocardia panacis TaxID=2340916 RepID=A0A3A4K352_9NOCA|nr:glycosyl transferase family 39 [Nocardia panacis]